ncbi:hypothetical protein AAHE18_15G052200 [Arachis hypogaea]
MKKVLHASRDSSNEQLSIDYNIWKIILNGPDVPTKQNADGEVVAKEDSEWTDEEKKKVELNAKAINLMHCGISFEEFRKVSRCKTAKNIWDKLRLTHEGTKQVRKTKIDMLMKEYEMFSMNEDESIDQIFERFSIIINNMDAMGRNYSEETLVRKILRSLTKKWEVKSTAISERNDLIKITYDELRGKLLAYETTHMSQDKDDKKKSIALKSRMTAQGEESDDSFSDEEMVLFARKMRRLLRYKSKGKGSSSSKDVKKDQKGEKSKKDKKKVIMATWEDLENDTSSESSDQEAQLCLMADHNDEDEVDLSDLSIDELHYIIKDISVNSKKLLDKYAKCKKENEALRTENDLLLKKVKANKTGNEKFLKEKNSALRAELEKFKLKHEVTASTDLISENKKLNEQIKNLNEDLAKFGSEKSGLGFKEENKSVFKPNFKKSESSSSKFFKPKGFSKPQKSVGKNHYYKCNRNGHDPPQCFIFLKSFGNDSKLYKFVCLTSKKKMDMWYLNSGCSRHMTGRDTFFIKLDKYDGGFVGKDFSTCIDSVFLVDGLKYNLLSINQLCDLGYAVTFRKYDCRVINEKTGVVLFVAKRSDNVYGITLDDLKVQNVTCFSSMESEKWMWHKRLGHASMFQISKLIKRGLDIICDACQMGKQIKTSFKPKEDVSTKKPLELLHLDLFGPTRTQSLGGKSYGMVIVDDYTRFGWVFFLAHKHETFSVFEKFSKKIQNEKCSKIVSIRSDHGKEFKNQYFESFCDEQGISHNFSCPRTPQQNGVVERRNRSLQEMARAMLCEYEIPKFLWVEAVNTTCYVLNRTIIRKFLKKTPYELWKGLPPNLSYFHVFGCKCFILNIKENLEKFDPKTHEGIFLGYSTNSKVYRVYNKNSKTVEETMHVTFCDPGFEAELPKNTEPVPQNPSSHEVAPVSSENSNSAGENLELSPVAAENTDAETIVDQEEPESSTQIRRPRE